MTTLLHNKWRLNNKTEMSAQDEEFSNDSESFQFFRPQDSAVDEMAASDQSRSGASDASYNFLRPQNEGNTLPVRKPNEIVMTPYQRYEVADTYDEIDFREYKAVLIKRKWSVILFSILIPLIAAVVLLTTKSVYQSTATVLIEPEKVNLGGIEGIFNNRSDIAYYATQYQILGSRGLAEQVVNKLNLINHPEFALPDPMQENTNNDVQESFVDNLYQKAVEHLHWVDFAVLKDWLPGLPEELTENNNISLSIDQIIAAFSERLSIVPVEGSQLVVISFEANDPELTARVANELSASYIDLDISSRREAEELANAKLNERLNEIYNDLRESEEKLQQFREREKLVDIAGVRTLVASRLTTLGTQLLNVDQELLNAKERYEQAQAIVDRLLTSSTALPVAMRDDSILKQLIVEETELRDRLKELEKLYTTDHPDISNYQDKLVRIRAQLNERVRTLAIQLKQDYETVKNKQQSLVETIDLAKEEMREINRKEFTLSQLQGNVDNNRNLYNTFSNRIKEANATSGIQPANASIIDYAVVPTTPFKPNRKKLFLLAVAAGLFIGIAWALMREFLDKTIKKVEDIESRLNLSSLGFLPRLKKRWLRSPKHRPAFYFTNQPKSKFAEAIRSLRTNVLLSCVDTKRKTIVVTSPRAEEGKSTVSINLALALAETNKVLLIDADMRRPSLATELGIDKQANGLSQYTAGLCSLAECVYKIEDHQLAVIPAGIIPPNPLTLLSSKRFASLLEFLIKEYDCIVIDGPPVLAVSDALVLSTYANGMIMVMRSESTPYKLAQDAIKQLYSVNAPLIGAVLNGVNVKRHFGYEAYSYGN